MDLGLKDGSYIVTGDTGLGYIAMTVVMSAIRVTVPEVLQPAAPRRRRRGLPDTGGVDGTRTHGRRIM